MSKQYREVIDQAKTEGRTYLMEHECKEILESAAPSLSSAIRVRLDARWYLAPLSWLPVSELLEKDYSVAAAMDTGAPSRAISTGR